MDLEETPILALVPARKGSESVTKKNLRLVKGSPLINYTFKAAFHSEYVTEIYLSTNDKEAIECARSFPVKVIHRPQEFCTKISTANDVVMHFISQLSKDLVSQEPLIIYLQPTSPLRTAFHIDQALTEMKLKGLRKLVSVVEADVSIYKSFKLNEEGLLRSFFDEKLTNRSRQTLPNVFLPNGAIYVFGVLDFLEHGSIPSNGSYPYIMKGTDSIDIDCEDDLLLIEALMTKNAN